MKLKRLSTGIFIYWIIAMFIIWLVFHNEPQCIDACRFARNAMSNFLNGTLYPSAPDLYQDYVTAVGYSDLLELVYLIFGRLGWMQFVNMAMNICIALEMYYIAKRLFSATTGYIAIVLYCFMTTNLFPFLQLVTEIPYLFFALSAFTMCVKAMDKPERNEWKTSAMLAVSGVLFGVAHTVRAIELAFLIPALAYIVIMSSKWYGAFRLAWRRMSIRIVAIVAFYALLLWGVGTYFKSQTGVFINGSQTGWYLLVRSADPVHPISSGWSSVYEEGGIAYMPDWHKHTIMERNAMFKRVGLQWISEHPVRYAEICGMRAVKMWGADYFYLPNLTGYDDLVTDQQMPNPRRALQIRRIAEVVYSGVWYATFVLCLVGVVMTVARRRKGNDGGDKKNKSNTMVLLLIMVLGTLGTCLFPVEIRYHYPYTWAMTIIGAEALRRIAFKTSSPR